MLRRFAYALVAAVALVAAFALPASADIGHSTRWYVALGDSLAYGSQPTHTPGEGYADQLHAALAQRDRKLKLRNVSCPGETSTTLLSGGKCDYDQGSQLAAAERFLRSHRHRVRLVTLDIGGNDLNACVKGGTIDPACVGKALQTLSANLKVIVPRLRAAAPWTRIAAMTYYNPYLAAWLSGPPGQELARRSVELTVTLNNILKQEYAAGRFAVADVQGAFSTTDLTTPAPLPGGGTAPLGVVRICQWTWMCAPAPLGPDIHANKQGYAVIAAEFRRIL